MSAGKQAVQQITLKNISTEPCTLAGFPDITLIGTAHHPTDGTTAEQYRWP
ncbi:DUF4232 domain-containing protein [Nocardia fluminea]|uniref:DUF4232 domain-containing protein n=1 Tax=Nocardia fluminea TaxID=134984 RepID=UPI00380C544E